MNPGLKPPNPELPLSGCRDHSIVASERHSRQGLEAQLINSSEASGEEQRGVFDVTPQDLICICL